MCVFGRVGVGNKGYVVVVVGCVTVDYVLCSFGAGRKLL